MSWYKVLILTLVITGCSLKPVYRKSETSLNHNMGCKLASISLSNNKIASFDEQAVYKPLAHLLYDYCSQPLLKKRYRLDLNIEKVMKPVLFFRSGDATRQNVMLKVEFQLIDLSNYNKLYSGKVRNSMGFNTLDTPFTEYISLQDGIENVGRQNAQDIVYRLINYLEQNNL